MPDPGNNVGDLSSLDRAAILAYEHQLIGVLNDPGRLRAVYSAKFAAEAVCDRIQIICDTAIKMLNVKGCEANLVTESEQINIGTGVDFSLEGSFCKFVVNEGSAFGVENATKHRLVCETTTVTELGLRAYLGLPLLFDEYAVGAFCVFEDKPREWKPFEVQVLAGLAASVIDTLSWDKNGE